MESPMIDLGSADRKFTYYSTQPVKKVYERWIDEILEPIWTEEELGVKPAKSVDYEKIDTPYPVHILNGFSALLSLIDHGKTRGKKLPKI